MAERKKNGQSTPLRAKRKKLKKLAAAGNGEGTALPEVTPVLRDEAFAIPSKEDFYKAFRCSDASLEKCGLNWDRLVEIGTAHLKTVPELVQTANYIAERIRSLEAVHSVKMRIKDPSHLMEKVVRKRTENASRIITVENYRAEITDLIGIRALHLFKLDWLPIHSFISTTWALLEIPKANVRAGDAPRLLDMFRAAGCEVCEHRAGYRSVHYVITSQPAKNAVSAELQVRTIFEEGWSEIDHRVRYPYETDNTVLGELLEVFNRLAGSADEMGSYVQYLKGALRNREAEVAAESARHEETVRTLKAQVEKLDIDVRAKRELEKRVRELESRSTASHGTVTVTAKSVPSAYHSIASLGTISPYASLSTLGYVGGSSLFPQASSLVKDTIIGTGRLSGSIAFSGAGMLESKCTKCGEGIPGGATAPTYPYCRKCYPGFTVGG